MAFQTPLNALACPDVVEPLRERPGGPSLRIANIEEQLAADLLRVTAGLPYWPGLNWFLDRGHGGLLLRADRLGGRKQWARRLGLRTAPATSALGVIWSEESALRAFQHFLTDRSTWPTTKEISAAQLVGAHQLLIRTRTSEELACELGVSARPMLPWTDERIRRVLTEFLGEREDWPTQREFRESGCKGLLEAVYNHGGAAYWADEFGLTPRPHGRQGGRVSQKVSAVRT